jgi:hypothetical protein
LAGIDPDLYTLLPRDKKEEYKKMFQEPGYLKIPRTDKSSYMWIDQELLEIPESWISKTNIIKDDRLPIGIYIMGKIEDYPEGRPNIKGVVIKDGCFPAGSYDPYNCIQSWAGGYITKTETEPRGTIAFIPEYQGDSGVSTKFCDYVNIPDHPEKKLINIRYKNI